MAGARRTRGTDLEDVESPLEGPDPHDQRLFPLLGPELHTAIAGWAER